MGIFRDDYGVFTTSGIVLILFVLLLVFTGIGGIMYWLIYVRTSKSAEHYTGYARYRGGELPANKFDESHLGALYKKYVGHSITKDEGAVVYSRTGNRQDSDPITVFQVRNGKLKHVESLLPRNFTRYSTFGHWGFSLPGVSSMVTGTWQTTTLFTPTGMASYGEKAIPPLILYQLLRTSAM